MTSSLLPILPVVDDVLFNFAQSDGFWANLAIAFGTSYDVVKATELQQQWKSRNFSQIPPIEVLSDEVLGTANGAYASSTNKIYLSASFLNTASSAAIVNVILEEIGHYVDAQINQVDSAGDEGAIFAELVQGNSLDVATLDALRAENDQTTIIVNGEIIQVEQANFTGTNGNDNITGTSASDNIFGLDGNDTLSGLGGNDYLYGGNGNDSLDGGSEDDYLDGGAGSDTIDGGSGNDRLYLDYSAQITPITITYTDTQVVTSGVGDTFKAIEGINLLSGSGADNLNFIASSLNSNIQGGGGNDFIALGSGNDFLYGQDGNDTLNAGGGRDRLEGGDGDDLISGGAGDDGDDYDWQNNFGLYGGDGNDTLNGEAGNDELYGGNGNDILNGGSEDDYLDGGAGSDTIDGGSGNDRLYLDYSAQITPITITYTDTQVVTSGVGDTFKAIEGINLLSGSGADNLNFIASSLNSNIQGGGGNDFIALGSGNDFLYGQDGNDTLNAGGGRDRLEGGDGDDLISGGAGDDGDDYDWQNNFGLYGGDGNDTLNGEAGNDELYGGNGNDILNGGSEDDYLDGGAGSDTIDGGSGNDRLYLDYSAQITPITITYTDTQVVTSGVGDTFKAIEGINLLSGSGADNLNFIASSLNSNIQGGGGNDFIALGSGNDFLYGQDGNDTLNAGGGRDRLEGGDGDDLISGGAGDDGDDYDWQNNFGLYGGDGNDTLNGEAGNDELYGGNNNDTLQGTNNGIGEQDYLQGGTGNDRFILADTTNTFYDDGNRTLPGTSDYATIADFNTTDDIIQLRGSSGDYLLSVSGSNTNLYINKPGTEPDELIAVINNQTALSLTASYFSYVSSPTLPSITLAVAPSSVTEDGTTNLVYTFTRTGVTTNSLTVNYTVEGTATNGTDYASIPTSVTFAAGSSTATVTIDPTADTIVESNETVILTLAAGTGYTIGTTTPVTGTINNDDTTVTSQLSINDITVVEGKDNNAILTVTVDNPNSQPITFNYTTAPINATANVDYTSKTGTITIAANTSTATISIPILNDNLNEPDEAFTVTLSNPVNATINPEGGIGEVIITDTWQSSLTRTLPNNVENLRLIGSNNINGTGNAGNNNITGNNGINQINGGAGIDTLTGGLGADTFIFQFGQSTISASDRITDFAINSDKIDLLTQGGTAMNAPSSFSRAANSTVTTLQNLVNQVFTDANGAITGNQGLGVNSAALVQVTTGAIAGTYLVINDSAAGFQSSNDLLINITGFTGTLPALGNIPVGNFFV
ncbi:calcium-binding protein [Microcystis aeruginosa NIES-298]|uniref:beta strand repeat-containing protein n=1 Tax=Microcystis aeruginosa TaxID=1126 RepID=UPI000CBF8E81|nr:Calx-beta domain-containing protein [Microcystis aeruginosa]QHU83648.1 calcium-binding protein [Microcystis aeruginosa NIES-298]GBE98419.1 hemolysin-type calcium-binding repeat family protein [Microcystis aeruginosa NIES-298]